MARIMDDAKRNELAALLVEFGVGEAHAELNRFMDKKDTENSQKLIEVNNAVDVLLNYLGN